MSIDASYFPHIYASVVDSCLDAADAATLRALRGVNRETRGRIDGRLAEHLRVTQDGVRTAVLGLPVTELDAAARARVRVVDVTRRVPLPGRANTGLWMDTSPSVARYTNAKWVWARKRAAWSAYFLDVRGATQLFDGLDRRAHAPLSAYSDEGNESGGGPPDPNYDRNAAPAGGFPDTVLDGSPADGRLVVHMHYDDASAVDITELRCVRNEGVALMLHCTGPPAPRALGVWPLRCIIDYAARDFAESGKRLTFLGPEAWDAELLAGADLGAVPEGLSLAGRFAHAARFYAQQAFPAGDAPLPTEELADCIEFRSMQEWREELGDELYDLVMTPP